MKLILHFSISIILPQVLLFYEKDKRQNERVREQGKRHREVREGCLYDRRWQRAIFSSMSIFSSMFDTEILGASGLNDLLG